MNKRGFTLIELLAVIVILSILATLGSKGIRSARLSAKKTRAKVEMLSIETAIKAFINKYGRLPVQTGLQGAPDPDGDPALSRAVIAALTAESVRINPQAILFLDPQSSTASAEPGTYLDPWGAQYQVFLDTDYNQSVRVSYESLQAAVRGKAAVIATGLYENNDRSDTNDLIFSWN